VKTNTPPPPALPSPEPESDLSDMDRTHMNVASGRLAEILYRIATGESGTVTWLLPRAERNLNLYYFSSALRTWLSWLAGHGRRHGHGFGKPR
jgi:hypothetical protein